MLQHCGSDYEIVWIKAWPAQDYWTPRLSLVVHTGTCGTCRDSYAFFSFSKLNDIFLPLLGFFIATFRLGRTGTRRPDNILNRFIESTTNTGCLTVLLSVPAMLAVAYSPKTNLYWMFTIPLGRLYTYVSSVSGNACVHWLFFFLARPSWIPFLPVNQSGQRWRACITWIQQVIPYKN